MGFNASPSPGPNNAGLSFAAKNVHPILDDPEVRSLERLLRVKSKVELRFPGRVLDKPPVSVSSNEAGGCGPLHRVNSADGGVEVDNGFHVSVSAADEIVGQSECITRLLEVLQLSEVGSAAETAAHATASDRHWYQAAKGRCGHTFPPLGGS